MHTPSPLKKTPINENNNKSATTTKRSGGIDKNVSKSSPSQLKSLPITRVRHIMEYSPGGENLKISEDAVHAMAKAAEGFIELLAQGAYQEASGVKVDYNHLSSFVHSNDDFDFIQDILPRKERFSEIMKLMKKNKNNTQNINLN